MSPERGDPFGLPPTRERRLGGKALLRALERDEPLRLVLAPKAPRSRETELALARAREADVPVLEVGEGPLWRLTAGAPDCEVLALVGPPADQPLGALLAGPGALWLLAGTAYPGNAGFVIRTAEVSGAAGVVIDAGFDREQRREALRASMRADRYMPVHFEDGLACVERAQAAGRRVIALETEGARSPWDVELRGPVLFVVGAERDGIPKALLAEADEVVRVPMRGFVASYNLQAAMAAVAAERLRQEASGGPFAP